MKQTIIAPSPGESITEVVLNWLKKDGDFVKKNEVIAEFESEKASLEVVAEQDGILKISVEDGKECSVGQEVGEIIDGGEANAEPEKTEENKEQETTDETTDKLESQTMESEKTEENKDQVEASGGFAQTEENKEQETTDEITAILESQTMESEKTEDDKEQSNTPLPMVEKSSPPIMGKKLEVIIPSSGESITEVEIGKWFKKDGEFVKKGEEILELESEKANLTVSADITGILSIRIQEGKTARVGDIAAVIVETSEPPADSPNASDEKTPDAKNTDEKNPGAKKPEALKEAVSKEETTPAEKTSEPVAEPTVSQTTQNFASPAAAKMMKEENITLEKGSGKRDRITKTDVIEAKEETTPLEKEVIDGFSKKAVETPLAHEDLSERKLEADFSQVHRADRKIENRKISFIRKKIAEKLLSVKQNTAMLTTFNELNMGTIQKVRAEYKDYFQKAYDIKLGFLSFFVKASCLALKEFPEVNSQLDLEKSQQSIPNYVDLGVAVSSPKGLMVPVVKDADKMGLAQIELEISRLAKKAREGKLQVDEMTGGTFTITNGGVFGSMLSTPILNPPQSAILGMHNIVQRAVVIDGKIEIADIMYLALSYDHRVIDGKEAVSFLVRIRDYLENPVRMLLEL